MTPKITIAYVNLSNKLSPLKKSVIMFYYVCRHKKKVEAPTKLQHRVCYYCINFLLSFHNILCSSYIHCSEWAWISFCPHNHPTTAYVHMHLILLVICMKKITKYHNKGSTFFQGNAYTTESSMVCTLNKYLWNMHTKVAMDTRTFNAQ